MSQDYKVDLRWEDGGRLTDRTITPDREAAFTAFRALLARDDLDGQAVAVRFVADGRSLYFSRFDKPFGEGRIHPDAPIRANASREEADQLARITVPLSVLREQKAKWDREIHGMIDEALRGVDVGAALDRLFLVAKVETDDGRRVAQFLMSWWNAEVLGGFDLVDLFLVDLDHARDIATVVSFVAQMSKPFFFEAKREDIDAVIWLWRPELGAVDHAARLSSATRA